MPRIMIKGGVWRNTEVSKIFLNTEVSKILGLIRLNLTLFCLG